MKIKELYKNGCEKLKSAGIEDCILIVKTLIEFICQIDKNKIILHEEVEPNEQQCSAFEAAIKKIADGVPLQYITNRQEFMGLSFYVDENVLIPQPDTEILVEEVIREYKNSNCKIMDLCTGSGAIAVSLAKYIENSYLIATDISTKAIQIAKLNAEKNVVWKKMQFIESDLFCNINETNLDAIVSNPPYIETAVIAELSNQVKNEPHLALDGGEDGLKFYKTIAEQAPKYLKSGGKLFFEIGYNQKNNVTDILNSNAEYYNIYSKKDLAGNDRIVVATRR